MRSRAFTTFLFLIPAFASPGTPQVELRAVQARMDKAAGQFKTMTADVTRVEHTDVINENTTETGTVAMRKVQAGEVEALTEILTEDNKRTIAYTKRQLRIYYPKIKTVQEWDLGQYGEQLDQFFMIGFGTSGTALAKDYDMKVIGRETVKAPEDVQTIHLRLIPKTGEASKHIKQLELWLKETGEPYPVQEKISLTSGDFQLVTYTNLRVNIPLAPAALQLKTPAGVVTQHPGK